MFALDAMMHATPVTLGSRVMEAQLEGIRALEADLQCISLPEQTHAAERTLGAVPTSVSESTRPTLLSAALSAQSI